MPFTALLISILSLGGLFELTTGCHYKTILARVIIKSSSVEYGGNDTAVLVEMGSWNPDIANEASIEKLAKRQELAKHIMNLVEMENESPYITGSLGELINKKTSLVDKAAGDDTPAHFEMGLLDPDIINKANTESQTFTKAV